MPISNRKYVDSHPDEAVLRDFVLGRLDPEELADVAAHLEECEACCRLLEQFSDDHVAALAKLASQSDDDTINFLQSATDTQTLAPSEEADDSPTDESGKAADADLQIPKQLVDHPRYRIIEKIGSGGMGDVFRAEHRVMQREVALKIVRPHLLSNRQAVSRFRNEVRAAAVMSHPNIVTAFDAEKIGDSHVLVMELVDGRSLAEIVNDDGPLEESAAVDAVTQVASGLAHAHEHQMIHRDLKPLNVLRDRSGRMRILDFGLARIQQDAPVDGELPADLKDMTTAFLAVGTPDFISPEQAKDARSADIRSDIYSLGCTFFFLLTGRPPFAAATPLEKLSAHLLTEPVIPDHISPNIAAVLIRMLAKSPDDRFRSPQELLTALAALTPLTTDEVAPAPPVSAAEVVSPAIEATDLNFEPVPRRSQHRRPRKSAKSSRLVAGIAVGVVGVLLAAAALIPDSAIKQAQKEDASNAVPTEVSGPHRVLVIAPPLTYLPDYRAVTQELERYANVEVVTAARNVDVESIDDHDVASSFAVDSTLSQIQAEDFVAVVFVGGDNRTMLDSDGSRHDVERIINGIRRHGGTVTGICGGIPLLAELGALDDRDVAASDGLDALADEHAITIRNEAVVVDHDVITATDTDVAPRLIKELTDRLEEK